MAERALSYKFLAITLLMQVYGVFQFQKNGFQRIEREFVEDRPHWPPPHKTHVVESYHFGTQMLPIATFCTPKAVNL